MIVDASVLWISRNTAAVVSIPWEHSRMGLRNASPSDLFRDVVEQFSQSVLVGQLVAIRVGHEPVVLA